MKTISRTSRLVVGNIATLLAAITLITIQFWPAEPAPIEPQGRGPAKMPAAGPAQQVSNSDIEQFPIFNRLRQPIPEVSTAPPPVPPAIAAPPELIGIVGESGRLRALLEDQSDNTRTLARPGDVFIGWTLLSIQGNTVQLQAADRHVILNLNAPRAAAGAADTTAQ